MIWEKALVSPMKYRGRAVIDNIRAGNTCKTIFRSDKGGFAEGQEVRILLHEGEEFIRTDPNKIKADNLDRLPEF